MVMVTVRVRVRVRVGVGVVMKTRHVALHTPETFYDTPEIINFIIELLDSSSVGDSCSGYG
jgi:hypothetical protein